MLLAACKRSCLAGNAHEGCQIHGMIAARGSYKKLCKFPVSPYKAIASYWQVFLVGREPFLYSAEVSPFVISQVIERCGWPFPGEAPGKEELLE